ncbi:uncharacterized protein METZ01_LOCUS391957, partial [marine metagenome]
VLVLARVLRRSLVRKERTHDISSG